MSNHTPGTSIHLVANPAPCRRAGTTLAEAEAGFPRFTRRTQSAGFVSTPTSLEVLLHQPGKRVEARPHFLRGFSDDLPLLRQAVREFFGKLVDFLGWSLPTNCSEAPRRPLSNA